MAHIEILNHIEFQYGGSKIQDCTGPLGKNLGSWMAHIEILNHIEYQYCGSKIQDCMGLLGKNLGSWILDLLY